MGRKYDELVKRRDATSDSDLRAKRDEQIEAIDWQAGEFAKTPPEKPRIPPAITAQGEDAVIEFYKEKIADDAILMLQALSGYQSDKGGGFRGGTFPHGGRF